MIPRRRKMGPLGGDILTIPHPEERQRLAFDRIYSLPRTTLLRVTIPEITTVEVRHTRADHLCGDYISVPDDVAQELFNRLEDEKKKAGLPCDGILRGIFLHLGIGAQGTYHWPFSSENYAPPELDKQLTFDVNLQFHDDDQSGWEATVTVQGSHNNFFLDTTHSKDARPEERNAYQAQLQAQLSYVIHLSKQFDLSVFLQAAGQVSWGYNRSTQQREAQYAFASGLGGGLNWHMTESDTLGLQVIPGTTLGANSTADMSIGLVWTHQFDLVKAPTPRK